jgi:hypothetical protein
VFGAAFQVGERHPLDEDRHVADPQPGGLAADPAPDPRRAVQPGAEFPVIECGERRPHRVIAADPPVIHGEHGTDPARTA